MARIRSQHPGQWTDEQFVSCSSWARLLALSIRNEADDQGVFEWKPLTLKMRLFPVDDVDTEALLGELVDTRQVQKFEVGEKSYGAIRNFRKYQRPKKPNAIHPLPKPLRAWVGIEDTSEDDSSEPVPPQPETDTEKSPQMEDVGGKGKEVITPLSPPEGEPPKKPTGKKRATSLPDDWSLPGEGYMFAARRGWTEAEIKREVAKFENHHRAKGTALKDWNAGWRTWVLKAEEYDPALGRNGVRADVNMREGTEDEVKAYLLDKAAKANGGGGFYREIAERGPEHKNWSWKIPADWQEVA